MSKTILITGAASGIGRATAERCAAAGDRVIGVDLRAADIEVDLGTLDGRKAMVEMAHRLSPSGIDGVVAAAGISDGARARETIAINYFGVVETLDGLLPLLGRSPRPRAVVICSTAAILPVHEGCLESCLSGDEEEACGRIANSGILSYATSKRALSLWLRRTATSSRWADAGICLNGVAPGVVDTPLTRPLWANPTMVELVKQTNPVASGGFGNPPDVAELLQFLVGMESSYILGQIIFIDGGTDAILRPDVF